MFTKLTVESGCRIINILGYFFVVPFKISIEKKLCRILHPRWRFIVWHFITLVILSFQLIDVYWNLIAEALKIKQGSVDLTYIIFTLFCTANASFGLILNVHLAVKINVFQQSINQGLLVDQYLLRKFFSSFSYERLFPVCQINRQIVDLTNR